ATKNLSVFENGKLVSTTKSFASMDRVILTEFKYSYKYIVARAVFGALIKTYLQYEAGRQLGQYGALAAGLVQFALTQADTRGWNNLPKEYQVARVAMPKSKKLQLHVGAQSIDVELGKAKNAIVFVRMPTATSKVSYNVIKL
ncbi:MAG: hypothetical protein U9N42_00245, partial [Campylobacterota bacterium]|nr:hypothetical protein [Campylobacterota bacterium]